MAHGRSKQKHRALALVACAGVLLSSVSSVAAQDVVTLASLEGEALADNASLEAREARVRAAAARIDAVRADMMPRLTLDVGVQARPGAITRQRCGDDGDDPDTLPDDICYVPGQATGDSDGDAFLPAILPAATIRLEGVIYDFGRTRARRRATEAELEAVEAELRAAEDAVIRAVRVSYLNWVTAHLRRAASERALTAAEQRLRDIEAALTTGARSEADRDSVLIDATQVRLEVARARSSEATARRVMARVAGTTFSEDAVPDLAVLELTAPDSSRDETNALRVLELRREIALTARRAYDLRHAPVLSVSLQTSAALQVASPYDRSSTLFLPSYQVQVGLTVPLWDPRAGGFIVDEAIAQAEAVEAAAVEQRETTTRAEDEARRRLADVEEEIRLGEEIVAATRRAAEGREQRFRIAGGGIDLVLQAQERVRRAEDDVMRSRVERADAVLRLMPVR